MKQRETKVQEIDNYFMELKKNSLLLRLKPLSFRKQQLLNLRNGISKLKFEFSKALNRDLGIDSFAAEITCFAILDGIINETVRNFEYWSQPKKVDTSIFVGPGQSQIIPEPYGVILILGTWNYPLNTSLIATISAIASGNCVILKPSEISYESSLILERLFLEHLDQDFYKVVLGGPNVSSYLTDLRFDLIAFTGSYQKGKLVAQAAAKNLIPCLLELGGKSPCIIDSDANLENAFLRITQGKFTNCGQTCVAPDYLFVHEQIFNSFINGLKKQIESFFGNYDAIINNKDYSRIINFQSAERLSKLLSQSVNNNTAIIFGDQDQIQIQQKFFPPFLLQLDKQNFQNNPIMQEEIFGPILPIIPFSDMNQVINYINNNEKPLALYYFGKQNKDYIKTQTSSGAFVINECLFHILSSQLPFGGVGRSGYGVLNGMYGFMQMSHQKPILDKLPLNLFPITCRYPPFTQSKQKMMKKLFATQKLYQGQLLKVAVGIGLSVVVTYLNYKFRFLF